MLQKTELLGGVCKILGRHDYETCVYQNLCFDIIARKSRKQMILLKVMTNIDGFQQEHANSMKILSSALGSFAGLVGSHTNHERLSDGIIYERFGISAFNHPTFEDILEDDLPQVYSRRGGLFVEIDCEMLRNCRKSRKITQENLAEMVGTTKKSIYEHEKRSMKMVFEMAKDVNRALKADTFKRMSFSLPEPVYSSSPLSKEEKKMSLLFEEKGFTTSPVHKAPLNMIAKSGEILFAEIASENMERKYTDLEKFFEISRKPVLLVVPDEYTEFGQDIPVKSEKELRKMEKKELIDFVTKF